MLATFRLVPLLLLCLLIHCSSRRAVMCDHHDDHSPVQNQLADHSGPVTLSQMAELPIDPAITAKRMANGLTYFIRKNQKPEGRVFLRLIVKAGSILEDDDQQGLAHFVEHMAFNGTEHFAKQELIDFLEGTGMRFGAHLNAYTSFDETVYFLEIPTDKPENLDKAVLILRDWARSISFEDVEIDNERGIVIEEWRQGLGAQRRLWNKHLPVQLHQSRYAERLPIGEKTIIETAPAETLKRFYRDWYRPDLMGIVVVGDVEPQRVESLIKEHFEDWQTPAEKRPRTLYPVPDHKDTLFSIAADPEATSSTVQIIHKLPKSTLKGEAGLRRSVLESVFSSMINQRLNEKTREANPPYIFASMGRGSLVLTKDSFSQYAMVKENGFAEGLGAMLLEAKRARNHGFTRGEFDRQKLEIERGMERFFAEKDKRESSSLASNIGSGFLYDSSLLSPEQTLEYYRSILADLQLEEVNQVLDQWVSEENRVILVSAPQKESLPLPDEASLLGILAKTAKTTVEPYVEEVSDAPLMANIPTAGKVVSERRQEELGLTIWQLDNGITVYLKPTDFKNDQLLMSAQSPGGYSIHYDESAIIPARTAASVISQGGLADFDETELRKKLAGKVANVGPNIGARSEGLSGSASPKDLETLFKLTHLTFTKPRPSQKALAAMKTQLESFVKNRNSSPQAVFGEAIAKQLYGDHPLAQPFSQALIDQMDLNRSLEIYRDRFGDASDFTFFFVGSFELDTIKPLIETYLGSLPNLNRKETWRDMGQMAKAGRHEVRVQKGLEPKSSVRMRFQANIAWNQEHRLAVSALREYLNIRLREILREELGGVYGVNISANLSRYPREIGIANISFGCAPENSQKLIEQAQAEIRQVQEKGMEAKYLPRIREILLKQYETGKERNSFWLGNLAFYQTNGLDPMGILQYPQRVTSIDESSIQAIAKQIFNWDHFLLGILDPEEKTD